VSIVFISPHERGSQVLGIIVSDVTRVAGVLQLFLVTVPASCSEQASNSDK